MGFIFINQMFIECLINVRPCNVLRILLWTNSSCSHRAQILTEKANIASVEYGIIRVVQRLEAKLEMASMVCKKNYMIAHIFGIFFSLEIWVFFFFYLNPLSINFYWHKVKSHSIGMLFIYSITIVINILQKVLFKHLNINYILKLCTGNILVWLTGYIYYFSIFLIVLLPYIYFKIFSNITNLKN